MNFLHSFSLLTENRLNEYQQMLKPYLEYLRSVVKSANYNTWESSLVLPSDKNLLEEVKGVIKSKITPELKWILVVGIGGSNLGTKAVYDALFGHFDLLEPDRFPKMIFIDTNDPEFSSKLKKFIEKNISSPEQVFINIISKSGETTETIANAEFITDCFAKHFEIKDRLVFITDKNSKLWKLAQELEIRAISIPEKVGGRYSVLSAVGLLALGAAGIELDSLRAGAEKMRDICLKDDSLNPALISSAVLYDHLGRGKTIHNTFVFHPELESLGKWYRQLMGESIGKEYNTKGKQIWAGITPIISVGSVDLHSVGQLYLGGPKDKVTTFIWSRDNKSDIKIQENSTFSKLVPGLTRNSMANIMKAILEGVKIAYQKQGLPFMEVLLDDLSPKSLGEFLQFKMIEIMLLARLMEVNAFDQPNVELYKQETRKILLAS